MMDSWDRMSMKASLRQIESYQTTNPNPNPKP